MKQALITAAAILMFTTVAFTQNSDFPLRLVVTGQQTVVTGVRVSSNSNGRGTPAVVINNGTDNPPDPWQKFLDQVHQNHASTQAKPITEVQSTGVLTALDGQKYDIVLEGGIAPSSTPFLASQYGSNLRLLFPTLKKNGKAGKPRMIWFPIVNQQLQKSTGKPNDQ